MGVVTQKMELKKAIIFTTMKRVSKKEIEMNADIIRKHLDINGGCSIIALKKRLKMNDKEFHSALDWLIRENKIMFFVKGKIGNHDS